MISRLVLVYVLLFIGNCYSQQLSGNFLNNSSNSFPPIFPRCKELGSAQAEICFKSEVYDYILQHFVSPPSGILSGVIEVLFEVDKTGTFKTIFINVPDELLKQETQRVFSTMPGIKPATYNGKPVAALFKVSFPFSLPSPDNINSPQNSTTVVTDISRKTVDSTELEKLKVYKFNYPQFESRLSIPFSHSYYTQFDDEINAVGLNSHTGSKPYTYKEVAKYYDFANERDKLLKTTTSYWGTKLWNEDFVQVQGDGYWFVLNPLLDVRLGRASGRERLNTFVNTRGLSFSGGLGANVNFTTTIYENLGRFADYYNRYAKQIKPSRGNPAVIPGIGVAKDFKTDSYDYPSADANFTFSPSRFMDLQLGYSRNFIGDGYRSILLSDGASPYPFIKINTNFWKIKYTNTFMWLKDVRPEATIDKTYSTKYVANHYLSWNVSNRLNLGLFESIVWTNSNNRGFDMQFANPIIFYRSVEFQASSRTGNALLGFSSKYKLSNRLQFYTQLLLDEFSLDAVTKQQGSWKNKFAYQIGLKYFNAFKIDNLLLQFEYNHVRPYVYTHVDPITNYGSVNQSLGHPWGANFKEVVAIGRYSQARFFADFKFIFGRRGFDYNTIENNLNYGGDLYKSYDENRAFDSGVRIAQGNKSNTILADFQVGYLINPATNLKLFASVLHRKFEVQKTTTAYFDETSNWFSIGLRSDLFNFYFDY